MKIKKIGGKWRKIKFMISPLKLQDYFLLSFALIFMMNNNVTGIDVRFPHLFDNPKPINENATIKIIHPLINGSQVSVSNETDTNDPTFLATLPWYCLCSTDMVENENEVDCSCEGVNLLRVPQNLPKSTRLCISNGKIKVLREAGLKIYASNLRDLFLKNMDEFYSIEEKAFRNIIHLRTVSISHSPKLQYIQPEIFKHISHTFKTLQIIHCGLREIPNMMLLNSGILMQLDFEGNQISEIQENSVRIKTEQLILDNNGLLRIHRAAFNGSEIGKLSLKRNSKLRALHEFAFEGITNIRELDLSSTSIELLPSLGLDNLEELRIQNTQSLKQIPSVYNFKNLERAYLTHSFHCCAFKFPWRHDPKRHVQHLKLTEQFREECKSKRNVQPTSMIRINYNDAEVTGSVKAKRSASNRLFRSIRIVNDNETLYSISTTSQDFDDNFGFNDDETDFDGVFHSPSPVANNTLEALCGNLSGKSKIVKCYPVPDELNPCEDVMGSNWLRICVWIVVSLTVAGNTCVLVVLFSNRSELTVPKFLMCNLALADFSMGLYLLFIASIDLHSMGEYFNFAFDWQYGIGCQTAGFLTVFAGHLSIFTLTIITVERWFAIKFAIYLNKRLKFKSAVGIMVSGWIYSICMATMPLFGISNYSSTSICLPMEARDPLDITYLISVLALNGLGFFIVCICYAQIYFSLKMETRTRSASSGERSVAKKMALLVFTNFACWAPIAFFGLTALAGYPLIDVTKSKILLVFFYPINSCANPYLYAILTAQYRRDFFLLLAKFGICTQRAQLYKMNFSNHTHTLPLNQISSSNHNYRRSKSNPNEGLLLTPVEHENGNENKKIEDVNV